ncbi:hypothetical protein EGT07_15465 [Herbaspirillum sp. HC18]|nr:hypothetical protein EGT07_15465 [Herbaspirillum sp. HC18]
MTFDPRTPKPSDTDDDLRQALRNLAGEQGEDMDTLNRRVMADWRREVAGGRPIRPVRTAALPGPYRHDRRRIGMTALIAGMALLLVLWVGLHESPQQQLKQVDVLSQMSFGGF